MSDCGCPDGSQIETRKGSRHTFLCISVADREKESFCRLCACIINTAKMQFDYKNKCVFEDVHSSLLSFLLTILSRGDFKKAFKINS